MNLDDIPGYKEALEAELQSRERAFSDAPSEICGIEVRAITLRDLVARLNGDCPFFCGGSIRPGHIASFLWQMRIPETFLKRIINLAAMRGSERKRFAKRIARSVRYIDALHAIDDYIEFTFLDSPSIQSGRKGIPKTSFASTMVHVLAASYHWSETEIMNLPLVRLYQYLREIRLQRNPDAVMINRRSDRVRGNYLRSVWESRKIN